MLAGLRSILLPIIDIRQTITEIVMKKILELSNVKSFIQTDHLLIFQLLISVCKKFCPIRI